MAERYYVVGGTDGWLNVKREPSGVLVALPGFLQVNRDSEANGRELFTVLEGVEQGNKFSVKAGNLRKGNPGYRPPARLQFRLARGVLVFSGDQVSAITHERNPVPVGEHPIQLPDFPHPLGAGYMSQSSFAKNWFYLGHGNAVPGRNDRYLHPGAVSAGCITVEPSGWTRLYQYLILSRSGDGKTVGTVSVVR